MLENELESSELGTVASQTQFEGEEPLFAKLHRPSKPTDVTTANPNGVQQPHPWWKQPKKLGVVAVVILVMITVAGLLFMPASQQPVSTVPSTEPSLEPVTNDGFQQRLQEAQEALDQADPADNEFPIPPVDYEFRLFAQEKN